jgi:hypothetical protein
MKRMLVILTVSLVLGAGTLRSQTPTPPTLEQMAKMMDLMTRMQDQMKAIQAWGRCPAA